MRYGCLSDQRQRQRQRQRQQQRRQRQRQRQQQVAQAAVEVGAVELQRAAAVVRGGGEPRGSRAAVGAAAVVGTRPSPAAAVAAGTMMTVGPASGGTDDAFKADRDEAAARTQLVAARAMVVDGGAGTTPGYAGNGAAQRGPDQGADAVSVGSGLPVATSRTL
jgi:hypothetical protein